MEEATGCALNLLPDVKYQESSLDAESGDIILIYTDGLPEAINSKDEPFGLERMTRLISSHKDRNASGISVEIGNALTAHEGDGQTRDDVLMIVLKFRS
jgi:serine phosphatase RsbU (regulator of sigma subunit)